MSVIVPAREAAAFLPACLDAVAACPGPSRELIVVDDGSRDDSADLAAARGARVLRTERRGAAAARNAGVRAAQGEILMFLDADCRPHASALMTGLAALEEPPAVDAVFGSYDDDPAASGTASQFKNLHHHWIHQHGAREASTFWTGCGLVRRAAFEAVGGFDDRRYPGSSMEDLEFGQRLRAAGYRIRLEKQLQVTHLKRWTLREVVRSDVLDRAAPWTELLLTRGGPAGELNLGRGQIATAAVGLPFPPALAILQPRFYRFLARRRGVGFALAAWPLHWLYFASAAAGAAVGIARHLARRGRGGE